MKQLLLHLLGLLVVWLAIDPDLDIGESEVVMTVEPNAPEISCLHRFADCFLADAEAFHHVLDGQASRGRFAEVDVGAMQDAQNRFVGRVQLDGDPRQGIALIVQFQNFALVRHAGSITRKKYKVKVMCDDYLERMIASTPQLRNHNMTIKLSCAEFVRHIRKAYQAGKDEALRYCEKPTGSEMPHATPRVPDFFQDLFGDHFGI